MKRIAIVIATLAMFAALTVSTGTTHAAARHGATQAVASSACDSTYWSFEESYTTWRDFTDWNAGITYQFEWEFDFYELRDLYTGGYCGLVYTEINVQVPYPRDNDVYWVFCREAVNGADTQYNNESFTDISWSTSYTWLNPCDTSVSSAGVYSSIVPIGAMTSATDAGTDANWHRDFSDIYTQFTVYP